MAEENANEKGYRLGLERHADRGSVRFILTRVVDGRSAPVSLGDVHPQVLGTLVLRTLQDYGTAIQLVLRDHRLDQPRR